MYSSLRELFRFFTDDEDLIKFLRSKKEFSEFAIETFKAIKDGELLPRQDVESRQKLEAEYKRLRNLNISLEIWNKLKSYGVNLADSTQIITGQTIIKTPEFPFMKSINKDNVCELCRHEHTSVEPRVCRNIDCNCGMR